MSLSRIKAIKQNFGKMFWIQALTEIKMINVISTIFLIHRGLSLSQILYTAIVFSIVSILTEVPSSYLADKWSRKGIIICSLIFGIIYWTSNIFAQGFWPFMIVTGIYAISYSLMSGTDEALVYDTSRELGESEHSLKRLGKFYSAQRIFKIITPFIAVIISKDLSNQQYNLILGVDVVANLVALFIASNLVEPKRHYRVEKIEAGVMLDAIKLFKNDSRLLKLIFNKTLLFISSFMLWRVSSEYFNTLKIPIIYIGITVSLYQLTIYLTNLYSHFWFKKWSSEKVINYLNLLTLLSFIIFNINHFIWKNSAVALIMFALISVSEMVRWPYFSEIINKISTTYNRATIISLSSLVKSAFDIPLIFLGSILIGLNFGYYFNLLLLVAFVSIFVFRIKSA